MSAREAAGADLIITGGAIFTGHHVLPPRAAVAVTGDRIVAVSEHVDELEPLRTRRTELLHLRGGTLLPGLQDAHVHPVMAGLGMLECDLSGERDVPGYARAITEHATSRPERRWITGAGWSLQAFGPAGPHRDLLDELVPGRPAYLTVRDVHCAWVNSAALDLAGIDDRTPDPPGGRIERDHAGHATGVLHEEAMRLVARHLEPIGPDAVDRALLAGQAHLQALGITAWQDALVGGYGAQPDPFDAYVRCAGDGRLTGRVRGALWWDPQVALRDQLPHLVERRRSGAVGRFDPGSVKVMLDGIPENHTAALHAPYLDRCGHATAERGPSLIDPLELRHIVGALHAEGFSAHFHVMGDRALTEALDAVEAARASDAHRSLPHEVRDTVAHLQCTRREDLHRLADLDVTATIQPLWAAHGVQMDELCVPLLGADRARQQFPFGDLVREGVRLAAGSDWGVSSADPLAGVHVAVNRTDPQAPPGAPPFFPEQRITLLQALTAYTRGSAHVNHLDDTGQVRAGFLADLTVLQGDVFSADAADIAAHHVTRTYVGGSLVHEADPR